MYSDVWQSKSALFRCLLEGGQPVLAVLGLWWHIFQGQKYFSLPENLMFAVHQAGDVEEKDRQCSYLVNMLFHVFERWLWNSCYNPSWFSNVVEHHPAKGHLTTVSLWKLHSLFQYVSNSSPEFFPFFFFFPELAQIHIWLLLFLENTFFTLLLVFLENTFFTL